MATWRSACHACCSIQCTVKNVHNSEECNSGRLQPQQLGFGHTQDKPIEVFIGLKFSLNIQTPFPFDLYKLEEEVKAAMNKMQQTEGTNVTVAPLSKRSFGNYGQSRPTQAWEGTFHYELQGG